MPDSALPGGVQWDGFLRIWWTVSGMLVLLMQLGFVYLEMGCVRKQDRPGIAVKNVTMLLASTLAFLGGGLWLMYGDHSDIGVGWGGDPAGYSGIPGSYGWVFLQVGFAAVAATIVSGALAGRTTLFSNVVVALVIGGLLFPIYGHWIWGGGLLFDEAGHALVHDFAGSGTVHFLGGFVALIGAVIVGPRRNITTHSGEPVRDIPFATVGVVLLWIGWIGFNGGSVTLQAIEGAGSLAPIGNAVIATTIAACAGGFAAIFLAGAWEWLLGRGEGQSIRDCFRQELLFEPWAMLGGTMGGMVAVTANCDWVGANFPTAAGIGVVGAVAAFGVAKLVTRLGIDDPVEAISVHAGGGAAGILIAGLEFHMGYQVLALILAALVATVVIGPLFWILKQFDLLRVSTMREEVGLAFRPVDFGLAVEEADSHVLWCDVQGKPVLPATTRVAIVGDGGGAGELRDKVMALLQEHVDLIEDTEKADHVIHLVTPGTEEGLHSQLEKIGAREKTVVLARNVRDARRSAAQPGSARVSIVKVTLGWRLVLVEKLVALNQKRWGLKGDGKLIGAKMRSLAVGSFGSIAASLFGAIVSAVVVPKVIDAVPGMAGDDVGQVHAMDQGADEPGAEESAESEEDPGGD